MKTLKPPFAYYGGKTRMAKDIAQMLPADATTYLEPFAGSLAVLLRKDPHKIEVVNDLDSRLVTFWRVLRDRPKELQAALEATPYARDELDNAASGMGEECDELELARRVFVVIRQSRKRSTTADRSSFQGTGGSLNGGRGAGRQFCHSVDSLRDVASRIRPVIIESTDALSLIERWDRAETVMYLDPPYVGETRASRDYAVENASVEFHERLVDLVTQAKSRIILSGYDHPVYSRLKNWNRIDSARLTGSTLYKTETLWANFEHNPKVIEK